MRVAMFQPPFWGAAYLAARAAEVDLVILSGTDQYTAKSPNVDGGWQYTGQTHTMLKDGVWNLPVGASMLPIDSTPLAINDFWIAKSMKRLRHLYSKSMGDLILGEVEDNLGLGRDLHLGDFNSGLFRWSMGALGIKTPLIRDYEVAQRGTDASDTALQLAIAVGATEYVSGGGGMTYLDMDAWAEAGVKVTRQNWTPPPGIEGGASLLHLIGAGL